MRLKVFLAMLVIAILASSSVFAGVHVFNPDPIDLYDLDHGYYYTWGVDHDFGDEQVDEVILSIKGIRNWQPEANSLFMHLLDDPTAGVVEYSDGVDDISDYFASSDFTGEHTFMTEWNDDNPDWFHDPVDLSFKLSDFGMIDTFREYAMDGSWGWAFDPDCHFYNEGISLTVLTDTPEPATMLLFGLGLVGGGLMRKRKK